MPRPASCTASSQSPRARTSTSTVAFAGSRRWTGSPPISASAPSPRRISARLQRSAPSGSSASAKSREASWVLVGGRSPRSRNASTAQLLRLRKPVPAAPSTSSRGRPNSWMESRLAGRSGGLLSMLAPSCVAAGLRACVKSCTEPGPFAGPEVPYDDAVDDAERAQPRYLRPVPVDQGRRRAGRHPAYGVGHGVQGAGLRARAVLDDPLHHVRQQVFQVVGCPPGHAPSVTE